MALSAAGATGIIMHEGEVQQVYLDPIGIPTVCVGHIKTVTKADLGKPYSHETCQYLLQQDTKDAQSSVGKCVTAPVTQEQYDSLVSFTFNVGGKALCTSTLVRKFNAGDCLGAAAEFSRWNKAGGKVLKGLTVRREYERASFTLGCQ
jgi:GH24 family phage-related lysozyme (muramidase)